MERGGLVLVSVALEYAGHGVSEGAVMSITKPQIFVSYSHKDSGYVHRVRRDLLSGNVDCWMDDTLQTVTAGPIS